MRSYKIGFNEISLDMGEIYLGIGYKDNEPDTCVISLLEAELSVISGLCFPRFGYKIVPVEDRATRSVTIEGREIKTGSVITPYFEQAESFAIFVATAGEEFDKYLHDVKAEGDILREFLVDAIGSEIAEATGRALASRLSAEVAEQGLKISNSYSPGYCGWHVREQQNLFAILPEHPCGITLSESSLMSPIKSISGFIAVGHNVEKMPYGCEICGKMDCYKKRTGGPAAEQCWN